MSKVRQAHCGNTTSTVSDARLVVVLRRFCDERKNALYIVDNASRDPVSHAKSSGLKNASNGLADVEIRLAPGRPDGVSAYYIACVLIQTHTDTSAAAEPCLVALRTGFSLRPVVVRIEAGKLAIGQGFLGVLRLSLGSTIPPVFQAH